MFPMITRKALASIGNGLSFLRRALGPADDSWYFPGGFFYGGVGPTTKSGSQISEMNAMQLAVVWCCIKILAEDTASLPLHLYRRLPGGGKERATDHPLYSLLHDAPNPEQTAFTFREAYMSHLLAWGNAYAEKVTGKVMGRNMVVALWPITPNRVKVKRDDQKRVNYVINLAGTGSSGNVTLLKESVLHTPGLSFDGLKGISPIAAAREAIGLGRSLEEFGALYFGNGTHPGVVVSHPGKLSPQAHENLSGSLAKGHSGLGKSHRLLLLEEGMKIEKIGIPNDEAQFLEARRFQNIDIGTRIYRVPPYMYGEMDKTAFANVEQQAIDYVTKTLRPWLVRLEQSYNMSLLSPSERDQYFFEHTVEGLLRGDIKSRYEAYAVGRNNGWLNADEIRELENMNPMEGGQGKIYLIPLNMIPADQAGKEPAAEPTGNRAIYRSRLESAYLRLVADAMERVTRKEAQRVNWLQKNGGDFAEFYRELPEYIRKQAIPAFSAFSDAVLGMESEMNGLDLAAFGAETQRFVSVFCSNLAEDYVESSRNLAPESGEWTERDAGKIAEAQLKRFSEAYSEHIRALAGLKI